MSTSSLVQETVNPIELFDNLPEVSFDINLGKRVQFIDFDYVAYLKHLHDSGLQSEDIKNTTILFNPQKSHFRPIDHVGSYNRTTKEINIGINRKPNAHSVNKNIAHETQHRIDDLNGRLGGGQAWINGISNSTAISGRVTALPASAMEATGILEHNPNIANIGVQLSILAMGYLAVSEILYFGISKSERMARKAEKTAPKIVSLEHRL